MLIIENISLSIKNKLLLDSISLEVKEGQLLCLLGSNGAGKSTLLKTIAKTLKPSQGKIQLLGKDLSDWSVSNLAQYRAVLSQNSMVSFPIPIKDIVLMGRYPFSGSTPNVGDEIIAQEALKLVGLGQRGEENILHLSGGEQQRVQIARVLTQIWEAGEQNPKLLLLDEPTSNLDIEHQHLLLKLLKNNIQKGGLAVLAIIHDINMAAQYATHIALLKKGRLLKVGRPQEVFTPVLIKETFGVEATVQAHPLLDCVHILTY